MGRPNTALVISETETRDSESIVRSCSTPHVVVRRAQIILRSADGESNRTVARAYGVSAPIVSLWRTRYQRDGLAGLHSELPPGRPRKHTDDRVAALLLQTVLQSKPEIASHWTVRSAVAKTAISKSSVARYFTLFGVQPHRSNTTHQSTTDPEALLARKGKGKEAKLCYSANALMENRNSPLIDF
jgi:putative transposase